MVNKLFTIHEIKYHSEIMLLNKILWKNILSRVKHVKRNMQNMDTLL